MMARLGRSRDHVRAAPARPAPEHERQDEQRHQRVADGDRGRERRDHQRGAAPTGAAGPGAAPARADPPRAPSGRARRRARLARSSRCSSSSTVSRPAAACSASRSAARVRSSSPMRMSGLVMATKLRCLIVGFQAMSSRRPARSQVETATRRRSPWPCPRSWSPEEWRAARRAARGGEGVHPRPGRADRERRGLPMVRVDTDYRSRPRREAQPARPVRRPPPAHRRPLHVRSRVEDGCPSCTAGAEEAAGLRYHLEVRDTALVYVSRAPLEKHRALQGQEGLDVPLVLVVRQRLQLRLPRHARRSVAPAEYNYRSAEE